MKLSKAKELVKEIINLDEVRIEMASGADLETALNRVVEGSNWIIKLGHCYSLEACYRELGHALAEINDVAQGTSIESKYFDFEAYGRDAVLNGDFSIVGANEGMDQNYAVYNY